MSISRKAVPLILATGLLTGCSGVQKTDWPSCAVLGGVVGAGLGAIKNSTWAGAGAVIGAGAAASYCWVHGEEEVVVVEEVVVEEPVLIAETIRVELDVKFAFDSAAVTPDSQDDIGAVADFMSQFPSTTTVVEGYTDSTGPEAYNQILSERRANAVRDVLVNGYGISGSRVGAVGYGESNPIADNATREGRAMNRRVEAAVEATVETQR